MTFMEINIDANFPFTIVSIHYTADGKLNIGLSSEAGDPEVRHSYSLSLGDGRSEERPRVGLVEYVRSYTERSAIREKSKDPYRQMACYLERYGGRYLDEVTTEYLQGFIGHMESAGLAPGTVRLYFQKLACVLHYACREGLFDDRVLQRVRRVKRPAVKKAFLTEAELKRLVRGLRGGSRGNVEAMFLFSCLTGLRFGDVQGLRWKDVKREGKHLRLEFRQHKTGTVEAVPLCESAEELLRGLDRSGETVFAPVSNPWANSVVRQWCRDAGVRKEVTFHTARHTFCVLLLTKEVPLFTVQQLMCHTDIGTTEIYADLLGRTKARAVRKLPLLTAGKAAV